MAAEDAEKGVSKGDIHGVDTPPAQHNTEYGVGELAGVEHALQRSLRPRHL